MKNLIQRFICEEDGQDIIEYALLAAFISICAAGIIGTITPDITGIYSKVKTQTGLANTAAGS